jgi:transmembrane sensor
MTAEKIWYLLGKKLSEDANPEELQELEQLMRLHPDIQYSIQNITDLWRLEKPIDQPELESALQRHISRMKEKGYPVQLEEAGNGAGAGTQSSGRKNKRRQLVFVLACSLVLLIGTTIYFTRSHNSNFVAQQSFKGTDPRADMNEVSTRMGSRSKIVLPDKSVVWLNAGSKLLYEKTFGNTIREVELSGEGYFDVVKDPERPFIIHTEKLNIKVLGTAFNVKSYPNDETTETSLIRGMIEVTMKDRPDEKIILRPNEKLTVRNDGGKSEAVPEVNRKEPLVAIGRITFEPHDGVIVETAWMDNQLFIRADKSFAELALDLERKYGMNFRFDNEKVKQFKFGGAGGSFKKESIQQALHALQLANYFRYHIEDDTVIIDK